MKNLFSTSIAAALLAVSFNASANLSDVASGEYDLDKTHAYISFSYNHLGYSRPMLSFNDFETTMNLDTENPENTTVSVTVDAASIDSRVPVFDDHLNGARWFDTATYPTITFNSTSVEAVDEDTFTVVGDLTIKGITKPITLTADVLKAAMHPMRKKEAVGIVATGELLRSEWGLGAAAPATSDEVELEISVEMFSTAE